MTTRIDLQEFLVAYLAEVEEHLELARTRLLAVDEALRKTPPSVARRELRDAFRAVHTIKGLSAMVGIDAVEAIAHRMETLLRTADRTGTTTAETIETLLTALAVIERSARHLHESEGKKSDIAAPADLLAALDALDVDVVAPRKVATAKAPATLEAAGFLASPLAAKLAPFERDALLQGAEAGRLVLRADFQPSTERAARGMTITSVREVIGAFADIVKVLPLSDPAPSPANGANGASGGSGLRFAILLVTDEGREAQVAAAVEGKAGDLERLIFAAAPAEPEVTSSSVDSSVDPSVDPSVDISTNDPEPVALGTIDEGSQTFRRNVVRVDVARIDDAMDKLAMLVVTRSRLAREIALLTASGVSTTGLGAVAQDNARQLRDLRTALLRVRMVPIGEVLDRLPLIVRGLRRSTGKNVHLELFGAGEELDKSIAERLFPALLHLVRNAVDHGLETPAARLAAGKALEGVVRVSCASQANRQLEIVIEDDGAGIDPAAVAKKAGMPSGSLPNDRELLELLCRPGLSTKGEVTTNSGRGMGMDIVRRAIEELGGELTMKTTAGHGTRFTLTAPLTLTIIDAFVFRCAGERFVVPVAAIEEIVEVDTAMARRPAAIGGSGGALFQRRGEAVTLFHLARSLSLATPRGGAHADAEGADLGPGSEASVALVVRRNGDAVAFVVDRVVGQQEAVVRPMRDPLVQVPGVAGTTDLGDGRATLVLDLGALALASARERAA